MDLWVYLGDFGAVAVLGIAGVGSAMGCGTAGMAAIGAWKKCYLQNMLKPTNR